MVDVSENGAIGAKHPAGSRARPAPRRCARASRNSETNSICRVVNRSRSASSTVWIGGAEPRLRAAGLVDGSIASTARTPSTLACIERALTSIASTIVLSRCRRSAVSRPRQLGSGARSTGYTTSISPRSGSRPPPRPPPARSVRARRRSCHRPAQTCSRRSARALWTPGQSTHRRTSPSFTPCEST